MKYMGSKARIAKDIVPIIQKYINDNDIEMYIEPFCGGCNVIDKIECNQKFASDINAYLIALFQYVQSGQLLPESVSKDEYSQVRADKEVYPTWYAGAVGFLASYNGRFFDGGYARPGYEKTKTGQRYRDYYREAKDNLLAQVSALQGVDFSCKSYIDIHKFGAVIYCDPPYKGTKQYGVSKNFDYDLFWQTMREWSQNNIVLISEETAPDDFECIWEKPVSRSIKATDKSVSTEKLFKLKIN